MRKIILGLMTLSSVSALGAEYTGRLLNAGCNTRHGIGEAQFAIYNTENKSFTLTKLNVVSENLCRKNAYNQPSKLVDMSMASILGGQVNYFHQFNVNSLGIVKSIEEIDLNDRKLRKLYSRFNLLKLNDYKHADFRIVSLERLGEKETIERIPGLLEMAKAE